MNFAYDPSGTAQQIQWAQDAIAACTYPLSDFSTNVTFFWVSALPSTVHGLIMLTQAQGDGSYKIFVNNRADDPNASHLVGGLDNPGRDIHNFYVESIIHELGHVVHFSVLGADTQKQDVVCGCLEIAQPLPTNGYRSGDHTDYAQDPPSILWADSIKEGIAESFKDMTYDQRVYDNRSNWKLVNDQVAAFGQGMSPATTTSEWFDDFSVNDLASYAQFGGPPQLYISGGVLQLDLGGGDGVTDQIVAPLSVLSPSFMSVKINQLLVSTGIGKTNYIFIQFFDSGPSATLIAKAGGNYYLGRSNSPSIVGLPSVVGPSFPLWLAVRRTSTTWQSELWNSDPILGGSPLLTVGPFSDTPDSSRGAIEVVGGAGFSSPIPGAAILDDFRYSAGVSVTPWAPNWPYSDSQVALGDHNTSILRMKDQLMATKQALTSR